MISPISTFVKSFVGRGSGPVLPETGSSVAVAYVPRGNGVSGNCD